MKRFSSPALLATLFALAAATSAHAASIRSFSPQGEVAEVRQVVVQFDAAVVPFGDAQGAADAVRLVCGGAAPEGAGRWVSAREWVFDFDWRARRRRILISSRYRAA